MWKWRTGSWNCMFGRDFQLRSRWNHFRVRPFVLFNRILERASKGLSKFVCGFPWTLLQCSLPQYPLNISLLSLYFYTYIYIYIYAFIHLSIHQSIHPSIHPSFFIRTQPPWSPGHRLGNHIGGPEKSSDLGRQVGNQGLQARNVGNFWLPWLDQKWKNLEHSQHI